MTTPPAAACWCESTEWEDFSPDYVRCARCGTLAARQMPRDDITSVGADEAGFYGRNYWFGHQEQDLGTPDIARRARADLPERCLHWLRAALKYKLPPARTLELGAAHGGFVALLRLAGFDATGLELSPWIADFARKTFDVPVLQGPIERQPLQAGTFDLLVMMDVVEHLPDPVGTLRTCVRLLKPDGVLLVQMPEYPEGQSLEQLRAAGAAIVQHLRADEHLHLFTRRSAAELMAKVGLPHVTFEPAIFAQYDQFFAASSQAPATHPPDAGRAALLNTPDGRFANALLDLADNRDYFQRECEARLKVIEVLDAEVKRLQAIVQMFPSPQA